MLQNKQWERCFIPPPKKTFLANKLTCANDDATNYANTLTRHIQSRCFLCSDAVLEADLTDDTVSVVFSCGVQRQSGAISLGEMTYSFSLLSYDVRCVLSGSVPGPSDVRIRSGAETRSGTGQRALPSLDQSRNHQCGLLGQT